MSKNIVETLLVIKQVERSNVVQQTEEEKQTIFIVGVIIDATIGVEGGGVANFIVQDTFEELDAGRSR